MVGRTAPSRRRLSGIRGSQLDELDTLRELLDHRQQELDARRDDVERQMAAFQAAQQRLDEANSTAEKLAAELRDQAQRLATDAGRELADQAVALRGEREQLREELVAVRCQTQSLGESVAGELSQACAALVATNEQLALERQKLADIEAPLCAALAAHVAAHLVPHGPARQPAESLSPIPQQRAAESSADPPPESAVRASNAAPTDDVATGGKADGDWTQELASLRQGLAKTLPPEPKKPTSPGNPPQDRLAAAAQSSAAAESDPVLNSLMAEFETLQSDLAGGRTTPRAANIKHKTTS